MRPIKSAFLAAALCVLTSCLAGTDRVSGAQGGAQSTNDQAAVANDHLPPASACTSNAPAPRALRRLTQTELNNTIVDIFQDPNAPQATSLFDSDPETYGFHDIQSNLQVRNNDAQDAESFAETVATYAVQNIGALSTCTTMDANCRQSFIGAFGKKAFRAPLSSDQAQAYDQLMSSMPDFSSGVQAVISAMLQSPYFLYRSEMGTSPNQQGIYTLTPYEVASELSYLITGSMPDAQLMQAADAGQLATTAQINAQAQRLLQSPRAHATLEQFFLQWLQLSELKTDSRQEGMVALMPSVAREMVTETQMLVDEVMFTKNGTLADLLTADHTFMNQDLASFYGVSGGASATFGPVPVASVQRSAGVLGHGGVISAASQSTFASPTLRGRMVRMRLLCDSLPSPPPGVPPLDNGSATETLRQRFSAHLTTASCDSCHKLMDPLGFVFGDYDTIGRMRPNNMENGQPVDTSGNIFDTANNQVTSIAGLNDLIANLAQNQTVAACMSRHWSMYAFGSVSWSQDACTFNQVSQAAAASNFNLQKTLMAIVGSQSFTQRVQGP